MVNVIFMALDQYHADYPIEKYPDHPGMSPFLYSMLTNGNYFFTTIFAVESFVKLAAMSPRYFFAVSIISDCLYVQCGSGNSRRMDRHKMSLTVHAVYL